MSADNMYAVWEHSSKEHTWCVAHVFASPLNEDCLHLKKVEDRLSEKEQYWTREQALVAAHDLVKKDLIVEYGVVEEKVNTEPCGRCFTCVNERHIVADDVRRCDTCGEPITDWFTMTGKGTFHRGCEPKLSSVA